MKHTKLFLRVRRLLVLLLAATLIAGLGVQNAAALNETYRIGALIVRDSAGNVLEEIPNGSFLLTVPVTKTATPGGDTLVFVGAYDADGRFDSLMYVNVEDVPKFATVSFTLPVNNAAGHIKTVKAFAVASFDDLTPVGASRSFPASEDEPDESGADAVYLGKVTKGTIYTLLGKDLVDDIVDGNAEMNVYVDGIRSTYGWEEAEKNSTAAAFCTGKGARTEIFIDESPNGYARIDVYVTNTYVMQAVYDYNTRTEKLRVDDLSGNLHRTALTPDDYDEEVLKSFHEDDYILYTYDGGALEIRTIEKARLVTGQVSAYSYGNWVTLDGTKYEYNHRAGSDVKNIHYPLPGTAAVVLDSQGFIVYVDSVKDVPSGTVKDVPSGTVYVCKTAQNGFDYLARIMTSFGKEKTVTMSNTSTWNGGDDGIVTAGNLSSFAGRFMDYELLDDDSYDFRPCAKSDVIACDTSIELNNAVALGGYTATGETQYIVENADGSIRLYTGVENAPVRVTFTDGGAVHVAYNEDNEITCLYVKATGALEDTLKTIEGPVYVLRSGGSVIITNYLIRFTEAEVLIDGEKRTLNVLGSDPFLVQGQLYKSLESTPDGYIDGVVEYTNSPDVGRFQFTNQPNAFKYSDGVFSSPSGSYFVHTDKVHLVLTGSYGYNPLMDDPSAKYETYELTFKELRSLVRGYQISASGYLFLDENNEIVDAYINIYEGYEI